MSTTTLRAPFSDRMLLRSPELSAQQRTVAAITVVLPFIGALLAIAWVVMYGPLHTTTIIVTLVMYALTTAGLTVGFHRFFAHRAFKSSKPVIAALAILGMMAAQGPLFFWVATHRRHHGFSDQPGDSHSPRLHGSLLKGLWHAHVGWMFTGEITNVPLFVKDMLRDPLLVMLNRYYLLWVGLGLVIPTVLIAAIVGTPAAALEGLLWAGFFRVFFVHHITWALNSFTHVFGRKAYANGDESRNVGWLAMITFGEGWHNNHHAFPRSARFGHTWWQLDVGYALVACLARAGLCWDVMLPRNRDSDQ